VRLLSQHFHSTVYTSGFIGAALIGSVDLLSAAFNLSGCRALTILRLEGNNLEAINAVLDFVPGTNLRSLYIHVSTGSELDWQRLIVILARPYFDGLDNLNITYWSSDRQSLLPQELLQALQRRALRWDHTVRDSDGKYHAPLD
jgi:hypothetical protein